MIDEPYIRALQTMLRAKEDWCRRHPDCEALIQFNIPPRFCVIAPIREAMRLQLVVANPWGDLLLEAIIRSVTEEPTVLMERAVLDVGEFPRRN